MSQLYKIGVQRALMIMAASLPLAACGVDDVQLNGKIFDAVGMSGIGQKSAEPKLAPRPGIVMPPSLDRLPEPGEQPQAAADDVAALQDPDKKVQLSKQELERQQAEYCKVHYEDAKARGDSSAEAAEGPLGPCRGSIFTALKKWTSGEGE